MYKLLNFNRVKIELMYNSYNIVIIENFFIYCKIIDNDDDNDRDVGVSEDSDGGVMLMEMMMMIMMMMLITIMITAMITTMMTTQIIIM